MTVKNVSKLNYEDQQDVPGQDKVKSTFGQERSDFIVVD